jgi:hypothetical protein
VAIAVSKTGPFVPASTALIADVDEAIDEAAFAEAEVGVGEDRGVADVVFSIAGVLPAVDGSTGALALEASPFNFSLFGRSTWAFSCSTTRGGTVGLACEVSSM